uniref:Uncharacterized protein LOC104249770 n=1 Tax=Nicotiana sylvestris TaxID=4096 RepID=A0A1U7Z0W7_NICSY|nr:PREDICTED: uncharacterized protein LOC104249770 [Nicotiana sylvestris]
MVKETCINIHLSPSEKEEYVRFLKEFEDIFSWSYDDMTGVRTFIVAHKLPTNPTCPSVKQKIRKFKSDMSLKIKEEATKQIKSKVLRVVKYLTWLASIVPVTKKDGKVRELPPLKNKKDVMSFLGRLNYISRFIAQSTMICEPIFRMLRKDVATSYTEECQKAFDKIKEYLSKPPVLVPLKLERPLLIYLSILDRAFGCVLGQHDETGRNEQTIYYLSKKFTPYEPCSEDKILFLCIHYISHIKDGYTKIHLFEAHAYRYLLLEKISPRHMMVRKCSDGAANFKGLGIKAVLVSVTGQHYPVSAKLKFLCTNNMVKYEACILGLRLAIDMNVQKLLVIGDSDLLVHRVLEEWATKNTKIFPYLYCVQELIKRFTKKGVKGLRKVLKPQVPLPSTESEDDDDDDPVHWSEEEREEDTTEFNREESI